MPLHSPAAPPRRPAPDRAGSGVARRLGICGTALIAALPTAGPAAAHVRWFVEEGTDITAFQPFALTESAVLAWIAIAAGLIALAAWLDAKLPAVAVPGQAVRHDAMELMRILTGMSLLLTAYDGALIAPHLRPEGGFGLALLILQGGIGVLLVSNHLLHHAAILLLLMIGGMVVQFGAPRTFEYVGVLGIALFILFNAWPDAATRDRLKPWSVDVLRFSLGLSLILLGIFEKLHTAALGQAFIAEHAWNFMARLGFDWFDDRLFVLSAGVMEVVFGIILVLGVVTRLTVLTVAGLMLTSNLVFLLEAKNAEAMVELIGHLPIIATAVVLLVLDYGQRAKLSLDRWAGPRWTLDPRARAHWEGRA